MKKINLNSQIKVKLNDYGKIIYYKNLERLSPLIKPELPKVDEKGFTSFQLWDFINIYGNHIGMCLEPIMEDIYLYINEPPRVKRIPNKVYKILLEYDLLENDIIYILEDEDNE